MEDALFWIAVGAAGVVLLVLMRRWRGEVLETRPDDTLEEAYAKGCAELARARAFKRGDSAEFQNAVRLPLAVMARRGAGEAIDFQALSAEERDLLGPLQAARCLSDEAFEARCAEAGEAERARLRAARRLFSQATLTRSELAIALSVMKRRPD